MAEDRGVHHAGLAEDANGDGLPNQQSPRTNGSDWRWPPNAAGAVVRFGSCYGDGSNTGHAFYALPEVKEAPAPTESWRAPVLSGSWSNYGGGYNPAGYYLDSNGFVHLRGLVQGGSGVVFTLPEGYRPAYRQLLGAATNPNVFARVDVNPNGNVEMVAGSSGWLSLDGLTFRAAGW